ncbi:tail protein [Caulobacter phage Jess A]|nr:tail protein [Caulobacter phage Jess A]QNH91690.1 hypothetical protein SR18_gp039c [Caulobacter phage SR18]WCA46447.1 tail protein [Caulobacter phage RapA]
MSINTTTRKAGPFAGNGVQTVFPFVFKIFATSDILAVRSTAGVETTLNLGSDYTVQMNLDQDNSPGGTVTLSSALAVGQVLALTTNVQALQTVTVTNAGGFFPTVFNGVFDKLTVLIQQILERFSRQLTVGITTGASTTVPVSALGILQWDATGLALRALDPNSLGLTVALPTQTGNAGKALFTNGTLPSWSNVLPDDTGKTGQVLLAAGGQTQTWSPSVNIGYRLMNGSGTVAASDKGALLDFQGTFTPTWPSAATLGAGWWCYARNSGTGTITLPTVDGATLTLTQGEQFTIVSNGTNFYGLEIKRAAGLVLLSTYTVPTGVGTFDVLLPAGYSEFALYWSNVSFNAPTSINMLVSADQTNYSGSTRNISSALGSGTPKYGWDKIEFANKNEGTYIVQGHAGSLSSPGLTPIDTNGGSLLAYGWACTNGIRGLRIGNTDGGVTNSGGTIQIWGKAA